MKILSADDSEIGDIRIYGGRAKYRDDLCGNEVYFRPLDGWWDNSPKHAGEFKLLGEKDVPHCRAKYSDRFHWAVL